MHVPLAERPRADEPARRAETGNGGQREGLDVGSGVRPGEPRALVADQRAAVEELRGDRLCVVAAVAGALEFVALQAGAEGPRRGVQVRHSVLQVVEPGGPHVAVERFGLLAGEEAEVGVARGVDRRPAGEGRTAALVLDDHVRDAPARAFDGAEAGVVQQLDAGVEHPALESQDVGGGIELGHETSLSPRLGIAARFPAGRHAAETRRLVGPPEVVHRESQQLLADAADDLAAPAVADRQPDGHVAHRGEAAERALLLQ